MCWQVICFSSRPADLLSLALDDELSRVCSEATSVAAVEVSVEGHAEVVCSLLQDLVEVGVGLGGEGDVVVTVQAVVVFVDGVASFFLVAAWMG